jgi:hypothetical protein
MPIADWSPDDEKSLVARHRPRIAGMGYRLAAAGPRTRQRLMEREAGFPPPEKIRYAIPLAVPTQNHAPSLAPIGAEPEALSGRLPRQKRGFPIWRSLALATSSICGFSLVIFGQTLHLERRLPAAAKPAGSVLADNAPEEITLDAHPLAQAAPQARTLALASFTNPAVLPPRAGLAPLLAMAESPADPDTPPPALAKPVAPLHAPAASGLAIRTLPPRTIAPRAYAALEPATRRVSAGSAAPTQEQTEPRRPALRMAHYDLPSWLTNPRPQAQPATPRALVMSPQPQTLDDQLYAKGKPPQELDASAEPAPPPQPEAQRTLPPIPAQHAPPIVYAEAQYPQQRRYLPPPPPPAPYGQPYYGYSPYGYGGYYQQPAPYYYRPPQGAW